MEKFSFVTYPDPLKIVNDLDKETVFVVLLEYICNQNGTAL